MRQYGMVERRAKTYQQHIGVLIEPNCMHTVLDNRGGILPWLSNSVANHVLGLGTIQRRLGGLAW